MIRLKESTENSNLYKELSLLIVCYLTVWAYLSYKTFQVKIFADDAGFVKAFRTNGFSGLLESLASYVPGRNLHILWQDLFFAASSYQSDDFWKYRIIHTFFYCLNGLLLSLIVMKLSKRPFVGLTFGLVALFIPIYSEVIWWASALPMHVFSTTLILLMVVVSVSIHKETIRLMFVNIIGGLAVFTYDQAAAAVFAFLAYECYGYYKISKRFEKYKRIYFVTQSSLLITLLVIYLGLLSSRNGNGPGLSINAIDRLVQNFIYLPASVLVQHQAVLLTILIGLFFTLITIFRNPAIHAENVRQVFEIGNLKYLLVALASYLPIAIWYVSPRHTYLPILFFLIWLSQFFSKNKFPNLDLRSFWLPVGLIVSISFYMTTLSLNDTKVESDYRSKVYSIINSNLGESERAEVCIVISPKDENIRAFQHEYLNAALTFYSDNPHFIQYDCVNPGKFFEADSADCLKNEVLQGAVFLRFIENWTSTRLDPSFNLVSQCGIL